MEKLIGVCNPYISLIADKIWLFVGQLNDRFLPYLADFLLHVRSKVQGKFDFFFLATLIEKLAIDLSRGPRSTKAIRVFKRSYFPCIDVLIKRSTDLFVSVINENMHF